MSVTSNFFILFRGPTSSERVAAIEEAISNRLQIPVTVPKHEDDQYDRFVPVSDADLWADVSDDGTLNYLENARYSKLLGEPSLEGRLFRNNTLSRWWNESYGNGPVMDAAITALVLLAQPDIERVWYTSDYFIGKSKAVTHASVHLLIDNFVRVGNLMNGRPARYIWSESGVIDV